MKTFNQLPENFKVTNGYRFSLKFYKSFAAQGINTMAYVYQIRQGWSLSNLVLNFDDVLILEDYFKTINVTGMYNLTKSGTWVRCQNSLSKEQLIGLRNFIKGK